MKRVLLLLFFVVLLIQSSCVKEPLVEIEENNIPKRDAVMYSIGNSNSFRVLPNPYALDVMQSVYDEYSPGIKLTPTDLYVKFMPKDSVELNCLTYDYNLELFDYPLDVQINEGDIYVNNNIPSTDLTWVYTTVAPDFIFPTDISYEIIEECYIPADNEMIGGSSKSEGVYVEEQAFLSLGYEYDSSDSRARPSGTIRVYDNSTQSYVPVKGVKIRCHNFVKWATAYTNESGYYYIDKNYKTRVHYAIVFDNIKHFDIWGNYGPIACANYNMGFQSNSGYSKNIEDSSVAWKWAAVNNAAYDYYKMCEQTFILKPPTDLKIYVYNSSGSSGSAAPMLRRIYHVIGLSVNDWFDFFIASGINIPATELLNIFRFILPDLFVNTGGYNYRSIYETVNHELSHASHFSKVGSGYWADYISYIITNGAYGNGSANNAELCGIGEMWGYSMGYRLESIYYGDPITTGGYPYVNNYWFKPEVFWDLMAGNILTPKQIFDCLNYNIDTYNKLYNIMCTLYPNKVTAITQIFVTYGLISFSSSPNIAV